MIFFRVENYKSKGYQRALILDLVTLTSDDISMCLCVTLAVLSIQCKGAVRIGLRGLL